MAGMELQNTVKEALNALYHHPDDAVRMQADRWLQEFQRTLDAWQVADNLLHDTSSNLETLIFCSQTLRSKVTRDFEELPLEAFRPLRDSLNSLLNRFQQGPPKVRTQISLAVAALAVHVSVEDWGDGGIMNWLKVEMNNRPECIPSFLELLKVLPEEVFNYRISARPERRRQFEKELTSAMEVALSLLTACLNASELKEQVLEAFASWLRLRRGISPSVLANHPLVLTALSSLCSDILSEAAVNVVSELIHCSAVGNSSDVSCQMPLIQVIVPRVMSLRPQLNDPSKDEEDAKAIGRLFADMGDAYVQLIATGSDESMMIVQALLEVASHSEFDIASMTFNFWHNLQVYLIERDLYLSLGNEASIEAERNRRLLIFRASYDSLVSLVSSRVQYPDDYMELSREDLKDFKQTRYAVADVLVDAALVLGGDTVLKILYMKLVQAATSCINDQSSEWRPAEAALYCIRAVADYVPSVEAEVMPQVMSLLPKLPQHPQLLQTVCLTIGAYSKWLDASSNGLSILPSLVEILMRGMSTSEDTAAAAALAFRHICDDCRKKLCGSLDGLFHIYQSAVYAEGGNFRVSAEDSLHLVEALSMVITELPPDHAKKALEALCLPVVTPLQEMINQGPVSLGQKSARELTVHIDRLAYIFRYVSHPEAVADAIQRLWPIFKAIFDVRAWDMRTMEALCKACKYAVRTSGRYMGLTIGAMLEEIQGLYQHHLQPCFLYLSSEVIKIFGSDPSCSDYLRNLVEALFRRTACLLATIRDFTTRPDIADDCFLLASRCIRYCPQIFIPSPVFPSLIDCAMIGITVQHREASNSILSFLSDVFDLTNSREGLQYQPIRDSVIIPRGATIARILIASLTGALPNNRFDTVTYTLLALVRVYQVKALEWVKESVSLIPKTAVTEVESSRFLQALSDAASGANTNAIMAPIEELSDVCRRNRTVQDIVQDALKPLELNMIQRVQ
ncbi:transportin MOS14-like [Chenopodium quinoa]|uniref:Importin N-terminal domain-containing protein n=1 Tax=Chenopodium quinoa TaxID=63459 RepID=A0A803L8X2_CHEQI|nr:transportin MOS14-like [Chenopodium quinoa]